MRGILIIMILLMTPIVCAGTAKIYPTDDAYIEKENPNTNFGSALSLRVGDEPSHGTDRSYLKFDLSSLNGKTISSAKLSIFATPSEGTAKLYSVSNNNWNEETLTWNNKPTESNFIESKIVSNSGRYEFNVLSYIQTSQNSFAIIEDGENDLIMFASKEYNDDNVNSPYVEVVYDGADVCPSADYSNVCCSLTSLQMMSLINQFNNFQVSYTPIQMMNFINKFNQFQPLC